MSLLLPIITWDVSIIMPLLSIITIISYYFVFESREKLRLGNLQMVVSVKQTPAMLGQGFMQMHRSYRHLRILPRLQSNLPPLI